MLNTECLLLSFSFVLFVCQALLLSIPTSRCTFHMACCSLRFRFSTYAASASGYLGSCVQDSQAVITVLDTRHPVEFSYAWPFHQSNMIDERFSIRPSTGHADLHFEYAGKCFHVVAYLVLMPVWKV